MISEPCIWRHSTSLYRTAALQSFAREFSVCQEQCEFLYKVQAHFEMHGSDISTETMSDLYGDSDAHLEGTRKSTKQRTEHRRIGSSRSKMTLRKRSQRNIQKPIQGG